MQLILLEFLAHGHSGLSLSRPLLHYSFTTLFNIFILKILNLTTICKGRCEKVLPTFQCAKPNHTFHPDEHFHFCAFSFWHK